jgi:hypothetical protein
MKARRRSPSRAETLSAERKNATLV